MQRKSKLSFARESVKSDYFAITGNVAYAGEGFKICNDETSNNLRPV